MTRSALSRARGLALSAALLTGAAAADMTEYPSEINNDCALFRGTWGAKAPEIDGGVQVWTIMSVVDLVTHVVDYRVAPDGTSTALYGSFQITCTADGAGGFILHLDDGGGGGELANHDWRVTLHDKQTLTRAVTDTEGPKTIPYIRYQGLKPTPGQ